MVTAGCLRWQSAVIFTMMLIGRVNCQASGQSPLPTCPPGQGGVNCSSPSPSPSPKLSPSPSPGSAAPTSSSPSPVLTSITPSPSPPGTSPSTLVSTPAPTASPSATLSPSLSRSALASPSPSPSLSPIPPLSSSPSLSPSPSLTPSPSGSLSPALTPSPLLSPSPSGSLSPASTPSPLLIPSPSGSLSPASTPSPLLSPSPSGSLSPALIPTPSLNPSPSGSLSPALTPSPSLSPSPSGSLSPALTPSPLLIPSPSVSSSPALTPSPSLSPSPTATATVGPFPTTSPSPTVIPAYSPSVAAMEPSPTPSPSALAPSPGSTSLRTVGSSPSPAAPSPLPSPGPPPLPGAFPSPSGPSLMASSPSPSPSISMPPSPSPAGVPSPSPSVTVKPSPSSAGVPSPSPLVTVKPSPSPAVIPAPSPAVALQRSSSPTVASPDASSPSPVSSYMPEARSPSPSPIPALPSSPLAFAAPKPAPPPSPASGLALGPVATSSPAILPSPSTTPVAPRPNPPPNVDLALSPAQASSPPAAPSPQPTPSPAASAPPPLLSPSNLPPVTGGPARAPSQNQAQGSPPLAPYTPPLAPGVAPMAALQPSAAGIPRAAGPTKGAGPRPAADDDVIIEGLAPTYQAVCGTNTTKPCNASSRLAPAPGVLPVMAPTPGLDITTGKFPSCTGCPANSTGLLVVRHFTTITGIGPSAEATYQATAAQLQNKSTDVIPVLQTVYQNACPACNFERWAALETVRVCTTVDVHVQVQTFAIRVASSPIRPEYYNASEHFSVDEEIRVRVTAVQILVQLATVEISATTCSKCTKLQQTVQQLNTSSEDALLTFCNHTELLIRWEAIQGFVNCGGPSQVAIRQRYLLCYLEESEHWMVTTRPAALTTWTADPNSPGLQYNSTLLENATNPTDPPVVVVSGSSGRTELITVSSSSTTSGRKLLGSCYYAPGDNEASGDNLYGAFTCQQQYIDYFWQNFDMSEEDWNNGMGYEAPCDLARPFARTMNAFYALMYSSQDYATNKSDRSGSVLKWAFPYTASNLPRLVPRCGSGDPYAGNRTYIPPKGDALELNWPFFYGETVVERAATLFHEAIHEGLEKGHDAGNTCARKVSCDSNWDFYGANTYQALYLWWFTTDGARTTTAMRRYARSEAMNVIARAFGKVPELYIADIA